MCHSTRGPSTPKPNPPQPKPTPPRPAAAVPADPPSTEDEINRLAERFAGLIDIDLSDETPF